MKRLGEILAVLDDACPRLFLTGSMHHAAAFDNQQLAGNEVAIGARQEQSRADDIGGRLPAPKGGPFDAALPSFLYVVRERIFAPGGAPGHTLVVGCPFSPPSG